jgi:hypothetical protein
MRASNEGHASVVTLLINYKADVNLVDHVRESTKTLLSVMFVGVFHLILVLTTIIRRYFVECHVAQVDVFYDPDLFYSFYDLKISDCKSGVADSADDGCCWRSRYSCAIAPEP